MLKTGVNKIKKNKFVRLAGRTSVKVWRSRLLRPRAVRYSLLALIFIGLGVSSYTHHKSVQERQYSLGVAESALLTRTSGSKDFVKQSAEEITYNADNAVDKKSKEKDIVVSGELDATGDLPFKVTLPTDASKGVKISDAENEREFSMIPLHDLGEARMVNVTATSDDVKPTRRALIA